MNLCGHLEAVEAGIDDRLAATMPPRHSKTWTAQAFISWCLGRHPDWQVIHATYAQEFADDLGRSVRNMLLDESYREVFPDTIIRDDSSAVRRFHTTAGGVYVAVGVGGPVTGRGAHLLVIDDPIKNREDADSEAIRRQLWDWYTSVAYTRLMPGGRIAIIHTRWREDDLIGRVLKEHAHEDWAELSYPAILPDGSALWPERYDEEALARIKRTLPSRDWQALYMQRPVADEGGILKRNWWKRWEEDKPPACDHILISMDTAFSEKDSADYSAITVWGYFKSKLTPDDTKAKQKVSDNIMLLDAWRDRVDYPDLRAKALAFIKKYKPDTMLIEKKASGQSLIQELRRQRVPVVAYQPDRDKTARAYAVQSVLESGAVWAPMKPFADMVIDECAAFPTGANDDLVDTTTQALLRFRGSGVMRLETDPFDDDDTKKERPMRPGTSHYA